MTTGRVMCLCKAGGPIPSHSICLLCQAQLSSSTAVAVCQEGTLTLPGARGCVTRLSPCSFPSGGSRCPASPSPHCCCPALQPPKHAPGPTPSVQRSGAEVGTGWQGVEGRSRAALPVLLLVPSRFCPAKPPSPCLCSSPPPLPQQAGSLAASFPLAGFWTRPSCVLHWRGLCPVSLKASCLGPSTICDALRTALSSSASGRVEDVPSEGNGMSQLRFFMLSTGREQRAVLGRVRTLHWGCQCSWQRCPRLCPLLPPLSSLLDHLSLPQKCLLFKHCKNTLCFE